MSEHTLIIGAGAAGCVLAARLTEDPERQVTLVEAGPDYAGDLPPDIRDGYGVHGILTTSHDWGYTARVTDLADPHPIPRGRIVGGSSAVNAQIFLRGVPEDFDNWEAMGCTGWGFDDVLPYFCKTEADADFGDEDVHGNAGPIHVRRYPRSTWRPDQEAYYEACVALGFPECADHNRPGTTGVGAYPLNNRGGVRWSAAVGYLEPARERRNLAIVAKTSVRRILFDGDRAVGVETLSAGETSVLRADRIVLCAGAIGTPHLLMLSGIGAADDLRSLGIPVITDVPGVGRNLRDHPAVPIAWELDDDLPIDLDTHYHQVGLRYQAEGSNLPNDMIVYPAALPTNRRFHVRPTVNLARSFGCIRLASADPAAPPDIDFDYFSEPSDRDRMRSSLRLHLELAETPPLHRILGPRVQPTSDDLASDDALDTYILRHASTGHHASGTCKMGADNDPFAVTDSHGRARGVDSLHIADASLMPDCVRANIQATVLMMAERIADHLRSG